MSHTWEKIAARAKIKDFRIHDFRHAYASFAINAGESLKMIGATLEHQRASTTERYAHLLVDSQRPVADGSRLPMRSRASEPKGRLEGGLLYRLSRPRQLPQASEQQTYSHAHARTSA